jgi:hypothetical protein
MSRATAIKNDDNPLNRVNWACGWGSAAAAHMFGAIKDLCGVPAAVPEPITPETMAEARAEAREVLADLLDDVVEEVGDDGDDNSTWSSPNWSEAAAAYHKQRGDRPSGVSYTPEELARLRRLLDMSFERAWYQTNHQAAVEGRAADSTVETLMFSLRERGVQALDEPDTRRRLAQLNDSQALEIATRLQRLKPEVARAWSPDQVEALVELRETMR